MSTHRRNPPPAARAATGVPAWLAVFSLIACGGGCTALIDHELSTKTSAGGAGATDSPGGGGGGGTDGSTTATTTAMTTSSTACAQTCILAHATAVCSMGECAIGDCDASFGDCNGEAPDGCEADLIHDELHCGKCDHVCKLGEGENCHKGKCDK